jgi:hypothetical protein
MLFNEIVRASIIGVFYFLRFLPGLTEVLVLPARVEKIIMELEKPFNIGSIRFCRQ